MKNGLLMLLLLLAWTTLFAVFITSGSLYRTVLVSSQSSNLADVYYHKRQAVESVTSHGQMISTNMTADVISDMISVTQSDDLELRGKWQRTQMTKFCRKHGLEQQLYVLPQEKKQRNALYRHLIQDPQRQFIFCFLPKVGCTNLRRLIFVIQGIIPRESVNWLHVPESDLREALQNTSFQTNKLTNEMRIFKLNNYFKFTMIRNPLERLVSAYRNKIQPPLKFSDHDKQTDPLVTNINKAAEDMNFFQAHRRFILSKYNPCSLINWTRAGGSYSLNVDFPTYVRWIVETNDSDLNEHFSSILFNSAPCRVGYHLFLNFKNYSRDVRLLIRRLNTSSDLFVDRSSHSSPGSETHSTLPHYYSQLSANLKRRLFARMTQELDFYYHLYPEEQLSHVDLLDIQTLVARPQDYWPSS